MAPNPSSRLVIEYLPIEALIPGNTSARTHSKAQICKIAASIKKFGFNNPVLIDCKNRPQVGHGRLEGAKVAGISVVPVIRIEHMTPSDFRAYALADNRLAEEAGWDYEMLAIEFQELQILAPDLDLTLTGFEVGQIDLIIQNHRDCQPESQEEITPDPSAPAVSQEGDLWQLGRHRIFCGDATDDVLYHALMNGKTADAVFIDPPYNVPIAGHVSGKGGVKHREFAMASGELTGQEFASFLRSTASLLVHYSKPGSIHFTCMDWRHLLPLLEVGREFYELKNICVWVKDNGGLGSLYRSQHELVVVFKKPGKPHQNNVQLGRFGRNRTNVWSYPGANSFSRAGDEGNLLALHPTVKPVQLIADALLDCTVRNALVLDCFLGSGSTLIAAERIGRRCYGMELDPLYVDTAIRRWQRHTGDHAMHAVSKIRFDDAQTGASHVG